jgi:hypothetical protein
LIAAGVAIASIAIVGCISMSRSLPLVATTAALPRLNEATGSDASRWLGRAGITPKHLTAAEVVSDSVAGVFTAARDHLTDHLATLETAEANYSSTRNALLALRSKSQAGLATEGEMAGLASAESAATSAESTLNTALGSFRTAALAGLTSEQRTALTNLRANQRWGMLPPYLTINHTDEEWVALRDAQAHERIMTARNEDVDPDLHDIVEAANEAVESSITAYNSHLAGIRTAWDTAASAE